MSIKVNNGAGFIGLGQEFYRFNDSTNSINKLIVSGAELLNGDSGEGAVIKVSFYCGDVNNRYERFTIKQSLDCSAIIDLLSSKGICINKSLAIQAYINKRMDEIKDKEEEISLINKKISSMKALVDSLESKSLPESIFLLKQTGYTHFEINRYNLSSDYSNNTIYVSSLDKDRTLVMNSDGTLLGGDLYFLTEEDAIDFIQSGLPK